MKSFSKDIASMDNIVSKEEHAKFVSQLETVLRKSRNWMFGLAAFNLIVALVALCIAAHH